MIIDFAPSRDKHWDRVAIVMGAFLGFAGVMHFLSPDFFDDIVPPWLPPSERFWTYLSGIAELVVAGLLLRPTSRRTGAMAATWLFIAVYPANIYMTWDWRDRAISEQLVSYGRLPLQFVFIWAAIRIAGTSSAEEEQPVRP